MQTAYSGRRRRDKPETFAERGALECPATSPKRKRKARLDGQSQQAHRGCTAQLERCRRRVAVERQLEEYSAHVAVDPLRRVPLAARVLVNLRLGVHYYYFK